MTSCLLFLVFTCLICLTTSYTFTGSPTFTSLSLILLRHRLFYFRSWIYSPLSFQWRGWEMDSYGKSCHPLLHYLFKCSSSWWLWGFGWGWSIYAHLYRSAQSRFCCWNNQHLDVRSTLGNWCCRESWKYWILPVY